jgi:hypothetical protein
MEDEIKTTLQTFLDGQEIEDALKQKFIETTDAIFAGTLEGIPFTVAEVENDRKIKEYIKIIITKPSHLKYLQDEFLLGEAPSLSIEAPFPANVSKEAMHDIGNFGFIFGANAIKIMNLEILCGFIHKDIVHKIIPHLGNISICLVSMFVIQNNEIYKGIIDGNVHAGGYCFTQIYANHMAVIAYNKTLKHQLLKNYYSIQFYNTANNETNLIDRMLEIFQAANLDPVEFDSDDVYADHSVTQCLNLNAHIGPSVQQNHPPCEICEEVKELHKGEYLTEMVVDNMNRCQTMLQESGLVFV